MAYKCMNNPPDLTEERFAQLEVQVTNINHNVSLLMVVMTNKFGLFQEDEISNMEVRSKE